ncbi:bifunctional phosphopantothenoylcysteine decarboxylase/phosphopantothenate--cysteine ligase CoaBC [Ligilactobacillus ceti]|uniref:Coenzyme A biosynthesis bifunctional protein CoaBC n=1 Tax=Ligilactobacillus ceti DSM 22408 TaxID=1122146 RepID=A0A0R2KR17_9LACO|nr:bifunctional phosphopantothenoylcysteine decarboxylase/phosphopantothenate--cysteine ligase CoaBC [Ligilactobacillus ceti]KRN88580.1 phosphopantothenoylcysteine decarboxylase phosphopantothenate-cysteine ligase [Ligilactobacillus ceti DSM 22408]
MKKIAVYVTGGVACYKTVSFVRLLQKAGYQVRVAMTKAAQEFVNPNLFASLLKEPVLTDLFQPMEQGKIAHIELADWCDYAIVVPATANIIAKMAQGIADEVVSTSLLATAQPTFVVPAMNTKMYQAASTQRNLQTLKRDGVKILDPVTGLLAEGYSGQGRMPEPTEIATWFLSEITSEQKLKNKRILITAGGTQEAIDPVRLIVNRSSGKMGYALAKAAQQQGAQVTLVSTVPALPVPTGVEVIYVQSAQEMRQAVLKTYPQVDAVIMAAAVADYRVKNPAPTKIKKHSETLTLELVKNPDILKELGAQKEQQVLVGFAAETHDLQHYAQQKLIQKNLDLLVANDVSRKDIGFGSNDNEVILFQPEQAPILVAKADKAAIAQQILAVLASKLS